MCTMVTAIARADYPWDVLQEGGWAAKCSSKKCPEVPAEILADAVWGHMKYDGRHYVVQPVHGWHINTEGKRVKCQCSLVPATEHVPVDEKGRKYLLVPAKTVRTRLRNANL